MQSIESEKFEKLAHLFSLSANELGIFLLERSTGVSQLSLLENLKSYDQALDHELLSIVRKDKVAILEELKSIASIRQAFDSPALVVKVNELDERISSVAVAFLDPYDKLVSDIKELEALEQQIESAEKRIETEQLLLQFEQSGNDKDLHSLGKSPKKTQTVLPNRQ